MDPSYVNVWSVYLSLWLWWSISVKCENIFVCPSVYLCPLTVTKKIKILLILLFSFKRPEVAIKWLLKLALHSIEPGKIISSISSTGEYLHIVRGTIFCPPPHPSSPVRYLTQKFQILVRYFEPVVRFWKVSALQKKPF